MRKLGGSAIHKKNEWMPHVTERFVTERFKSRMLVVCVVASAIAAAMTPIVRPTAALAQSARIEVPFGDKVGPAVTNYNRLRPGIATAGQLRGGAIGELKSLGFATILDLRTANEGTDVEKRAAEAAGLRYFNIPIADGLPSDAQIDAFARVVEDAGHVPLMIHCGSANRVGTMWTLYRARKGIPIAIAVEEGRTIGMQPSREEAVLKRLGQPASGR